MTGKILVLAEVNRADVPDNLGRFHLAYRHQTVGGVVLRLQQTLGHAGELRHTVLPRTTITNLQNVAVGTPKYGFEHRAVTLDYF